MKKRTAQGGYDDAVNMDVMMDNMTNVVGTLLLVLIITQLGVSNTVERIEETLAVVTPQQVEALRQQVAAAADPRALAAKLKAERDQLKRIEGELDKTGIKFVDIEELERKLTEQRRLVDEQKIAMDRLIAERARLQGVLDETKVVNRLPPKDVRLPPGGTVPANARFQPVLVWSNRVYFSFNTARFAAQAAREFDRYKSTMLKSNLVSADRKTVTPVYDRAKVKLFLDRLRLGDAYYGVFFPVIDPMSDRAVIEARPRPTAGETADRLVLPNPAFAGYLQFIRNLGRTNSQVTPVVQFFVHPNSIDAYNRARDLCAQAGVPAVWEFTGRTSITEPIMNFVVNRLQEPPATAPTAAPAPASSIPKPARTLD